MPELSIIIPVYNTEKYLSECIDSILNQSFADYELILVNDGSTDGCGDICRSYAQKDSRIVFLEQENGGVSGARNNGLSVAKGEYVLFCDSDDTMVSGTLDKIMSYVLEKNYDITMCTYIMDFEDGSEPFAEEIDFDESKHSSMCAIISEYVRGIVPWSACRNVIKRSIIEDNDIRYDESFSCAEDCDFYFKVCRFSASFGSINQPVIRYRAAREDSTSNTYNKTNIESTSRVYKKWQSFFEDNYGKSADGILECFSEHYFYLILNAAKSEIDSEIYSVFEEYKSILRHAKGWKKRAVKLCYDIFGVEKGVNLFRGR